MNTKKNKFTFPFTSAILITSLILLFLPFILLNFFDFKLIESNPFILKLIMLLLTLLSTVGFIYCTLGFHFKIIKGDELKFRIHLEALNIAFTTSLVFLFALIFVFLNFNPTLLNYLIIILAVISIVAYIIGIEIVKRKYR